MFDVIHQWIRLNELYKLMETFFSNFVFEFLAKKQTKKIQKNSEAWILINLQCVIYQWTRLNKLYKLMESFFANFEIIFRIGYNFFQIVVASWGGGGICAQQHAF